MMNQANRRISGVNDQTILSPNAKHSIGTAASMIENTETCCADDEWIREEERKRIAREIHDELGQQLLVLRMDVLRLRDHIAETHPKLIAVVGDVLLQLDRTMQSVRAIIRGLRPAVLDLGLHAAMEWYCADFKRRAGIACDMTWNAGELTMPDSYAIALFRTLQESLTNVQRHAHASRVSIIVHIDRENVVMTISDNGVGKVSVVQTNMNSFGLYGMRERIAALGGQMDIRSTAHKGMTLTVSLPL